VDGPLVSQTGRQRYWPATLEFRCPATVIAHAEPRPRPAAEPAMAEILKRAVEPARLSTL
jgi:hypothetical protein